MNEIVYNNPYNHMKNYKRPRSKDNVAIIIPAYNEGSAIVETINNIPDTYSCIVCVNDGSRDDTAQQIMSTRAQLVNHPINLGQGAALQTGIEYALELPGIDYFVTYDADGQHRIEDVNTMLDYIVKHPNTDIVLGSRFLGKAENISPIKKIVLKMAIQFTNASTGVKLTDTHNGLRVFNRKVAKGLNLQMPDFAHASEIIDRIAEKKYTYKELPVTIIYTDYSRGKGQSIINAVNIGFDIIIGRMVGR
jgi:polyprenyl-phospho-N-acetylgalactosaminyl synthase